MQAWFFGLEPSSSGATTFWTTTNARTFTATYPDITATFYATPQPGYRASDIVNRLLTLETADHSNGTKITVVDKRLNIHYQQTSQALEFSIPFDRLQAMTRIFNDGVLPITIFNADLSPFTQFFYRTGIFPFAKTDITVTGSTLSKYQLLDDIQAVEYEMPPVRAIGLDLQYTPLGSAPHLLSASLRPVPFSTLILDDVITLEG